MEVKIRARSACRGGPRAVSRGVPSRAPFDDVCRFRLCTYIRVGLCFVPFKTGMFSTASFFVQTVSSVALTQTFSLTTHSNEFTVDRLQPILIAMKFGDVCAGSFRSDGNGNWFYHGFLGAQTKLEPAVDPSQLCIRILHSNKSLNNNEFDSGN